MGHSHFVLTSRSRKTKDKCDMNDVCKVQSCGWKCINLSCRQRVNGVHLSDGRWRAHYLPRSVEVGTWSTLHLASNALLYAYMALPFGMLQVQFLAIWALEHHFPKLEGGRRRVPSITPPGDLGTWAPLPNGGRRKCGQWCPSRSVIQAERKGTSSSGRHGYHHIVA